MTKKPTYKELAAMVQQLKQQAAGQNTDDMHQEGQRKFLKILDSLKAIVYVADMQTCEILYVNKYTWDIFGARVGDICWQTLQGGREKQCDFCSNDKLVDAEGRILEEYCWEFCNTRNHRWYEMHDRAIEWLDGRIVRLEISIDITDRKRFEAILARRTRALEVLSKCNESLIRSQSEPELLLDICEILVEVGRYSLAWVGFAEDNTEKTVRPVAQCGDDDNYIAALNLTWSGTHDGHDVPEESAIRTGKMVCVKNIREDNGFRLWSSEALKRGYCSCVSMPLPVDRKIIGVMSIYARECDVFDEEEIALLRKLADNLAYGIAGLRLKKERRAAERKLKAAHEYLSLIMESLPIIPYTRRADGDFTITYMGKSVHVITGYTAAQFMDDPSFWINHVHPDDRNGVASELQFLLKEGIQRREYRLQAADGSYKWISSCSRLIKDADGRNDHIVGAAQDISEEKRMKQEADMHMQQVIQADKLASLGEVVAGVAHEINNPNSFITYNIPLLEESWEIFVPIINDYVKKHPGSKHGNITLEEMAGEMGEIIAAIKTGSDRINKIVANLKDFARLDESAPSRLVDFNEVINDTLTIVGAHVRKSAGRIELDLADNLPQFHGHFQKLEQVMANLIMNAAQAVTKKERGGITIRTRLNMRLNSIIVEVEDNGRGMAPHETERIFEPFFTTRRSSGGTGLGLSVSYGLVQEHKGRIGVLSRSGQGTKFTVIIPIDRRQSQIDLQPTILCVDADSQTLIQLNSFFVNVRNLPARSISSADEVIAFLQDHPEVDMILCDVLMHEVVGRPLLENIKREFPLLPVICIADRPEQQRLTDGHDFRPEYLLSKPLELEKLERIIRTIGRLRI